MNANGIFATGDLPFSAFLICTKKLPFLRCERIKDGSIRFLFADSEGKGNQFFMDYQGGALAPALPFYASVKFLRQAMNLGKGGEYGY